MDFRFKKFYTAIAIMAAGMFVAIMWHGWQGLVLGRNYPYNTFLGLPNYRFSDFTGNLVPFCAAPSPYDYWNGVYFPAAYVAFRPFLWMPASLGIVLFFGICLSGFFIVVVKAFQPLFLNPRRLLICSFSLLILSYPLLFCIDRGNIEILLALLAAITLLLWKNRHYTAGCACLLPAICFKLFPALLALLLLRRRHWRQFLSLGFASILITLGCAATFKNSLLDNYQKWKFEIHRYENHFIIDNYGAAGSASAWNAYKATVVTAARFSDKFWNTHYSNSLVESYLVAYRIYQDLMMPLFIGVLFFSLFIEKEFFRRAILLLALMTMATTTGCDYRLLYAGIALIILILLETRRPRDLLAVALLAFIQIPKKELLLTSMGPTDTKFCDVPIAILINPLCLFATMGLLMIDGFKGWKISQTKQKISGLLKLLWPLQRSS